MDELTHQVPTDSMGILQLQLAMPNNMISAMVSIVVSSHRLFSAYCLVITLIVKWKM